MDDPSETHGMCHACARDEVYMTQRRAGEGECRTCRWCDRGVCELHGGKRGRTRCRQWDPCDGDGCVAPPGAPPRRSMLADLEDVRYDGGAKLLDDLRRAMRDLGMPTEDDRWPKKS